MAFDEDRVPNLYDDRGVLQDIHSVSSLLKMYFRELPNPVCTYHLYDKFVEAAKAAENQRLVMMRDVVQQLPPPNYRYVMAKLYIPNTIDTLVRLLFWGRLGLSGQYQTFLQFS